MPTTARPKGFHNPAMTTSSAATMKAPVAAGNPPSGTPVEISNAAPGVDHAMLIGWRVMMLWAAPRSPVTTQSASRPDAAWAGEAPTPAKPWSTIGKALPKPTMAARKPAVTGWSRDCRAEASGTDLVGKSLGMPFSRALDNRMVVAVRSPTDYIKIGSNQQMDIG